MLRLFGGSRSSSRAASPARPHHTKRGVRLQINVPSYGGVFMNNNRTDVQHDDPEASGSSLGPPRLELQDSELSGELEVDVPRGMGRRRCRAIRMTLKNTCRLNMGPARMWEEDVLFERTIEVKGAIILQEGVQRFNFTIVIPYGLAGYDVHPTGRVKLELIAEVEGLGGGPRSVSTHMISPSPSPAPTPRRGRSPERGHGPRSVNASPYTSGASTPVGDGGGVPSMDIATQMTVSWADPVGHSEEEVRWLRGNVVASRGIWLMYNPDPEDGVSTLNERRRGEVPGLGPFEIRFMSDVWTVCALLKSTININFPEPTCTIYYIRIVLTQTTSIRSPRDDPATTEPIRSTIPFVVWEKGVRPPRQLARDSPALWRGTECGGEDTGSLQVTGMGRLPNDETGRPSTLEGVITPIHVKHQLVVEVWYSIAGQDVQGNELPAGNIGGLRMLRVDKPVIVPSCGFIPEVVELPSYDSLKFDTAPCPVCGTPAEQQACRTCPLTSVPHSRHDHDPLVVGNANGVCPRCERRFITDPDDDLGKWADCACGLSLKKLEERMRSVIPDEDLQDDGYGGQVTPPVKIERGRSM